jgi:hypothetical protein
MKAMPGLGNIDGPGIPTVRHRIALNRAIAIVPKSFPSPRHYPPCTTRCCVVLCSRRRCWLVVTRSRVVRNRPLDCFVRLIVGCRVVVLVIGQVRALLLACYASWSRERNLSGNLASGDWNRARGRTVFRLAIATIRVSEPIWIVRRVAVSVEVWAKTTTA